MSQLPSCIGYIHIGYMYLTAVRLRQLLPSSSIDNYYRVIKIYSQPILADFD